jgi:hypothetical protein
MRRSLLDMTADSGPIVLAPDERRTWCKNWQGKPNYSEITLPSANLSTVNPASLDLKLNPGP